MSETTNKFSPEVREGGGGFDWKRDIRRDA
jgi:hypothetical protein